MISMMVLRRVAKIKVVDLASYFHAVFAASICISLLTACIASQPKYNEIHISLPTISERLKNWAHESDDQLRDALAQGQPDVAKWWKTIQEEKTAALSEEELLKLINDTVNQNTVYVHDWEHWHRKDYWEPIVSAIVEGGDCEDFALLKASSLTIDGWPPERLRILIGHVTVNRKKVAHAVLLATTKAGKEFVLDNRSHWVLPLLEFEQKFEPLYSIDENGTHSVVYRKAPDV